jgi:hypothetical protein
MTAAVPDGPLPGDTSKPPVDRSVFSDSSSDPHLDNYTDETRADSDRSEEDEEGLWAFDYDCLGFTVKSMSGDKEDAVEKFDLVSDVDFTMGKGCARFNYGVPGKAPVALPRGIGTACPEGQVPPNTGSDYDGNTHDLAIDCMIWKQIANGVTSPKDYDPAVAVNRERMASFVARLITAAGGELPARARTTRASPTRPTRPTRTTSTSSPPPASSVARGTGPYAPKESVTRGQMATFLVRAYEYLSDGALVPQGDYFADDDGTTHEANIDKAAAAGFTAGRANGGYEPARRSCVTRWRPSWPAPSTCWSRRRTPLRSQDRRRRASGPGRPERATRTDRRPAPLTGAGLPAFAGHAHPAARGGRRRLRGSEGRGERRPPGGGP